MKISYVPKKFNASSLKLIAQANTIIAEYQRQGYMLTLRQLYYQFVSRDIIANKVTEYKRLGSIINDARLAGQIDWDAIEDRTRNLKALATWDNPASIIEVAARQFKRDLWATQPRRIEVWIEKEALAGVFERVCQEMRTPFFACRGYVSQSEMHVAAKRLEDYAYHGQSPLILHFGDHDPSGIDMSRDIESRLRMFSSEPIEVQRLALNMDQVQKYQPPPNPAKETDSRFAEYLRTYGDESWELDALDPSQLSALVTEAVQSYIDDDAWEEAEALEERQRQKLTTLSANYED